MRKTAIIIILLISLACKSQVNNELTFDSVSLKLIEYYYHKGDIDFERFKKLQNKEHKFSFVGLLNGTDSGHLKDGVYVFSLLSSHSQMYYLIIENNRFEILSLINRRELDLTISKILDFSERKKYCVEITKEIVISIIDSFYKYNKNPLNRIDVNCEKGVVDKKDLP